jgi:hypothetical protein
VLRRVHLTAAAIGFATILTFWTSTVIVELFGSDEAIRDVKQVIPWGFLLLVPALAVTGATGFALAGKGTERRIRAKKRRMPFVAGNGLLVLIPAALYLDHLASRGDFGGRFVVVQAIELVAGAVNLTLMSLNVRDGLGLSGRVKLLRWVGTSGT